jgi:hypothetical protein
MRQKRKIRGKKLNMHTRNQSGFGVIPIVLIVAAVAILGYVGYRIYTTQTSKPAANSSVANNQTSPTNTTPSPTTSTQPQADTYLDIKELGIKIKLSDSIKDAVYSYSAPTSQTYATFGGSAYLSTQTLTSKDTTCAASKDPLGAIVKITGNTDGLGNSLTADNNTVFKLGDSYYRYENPQSPCSDNSDANALATQQKAAFREAFKTVQLDK